MFQDAVGTKRYESNSGGEREIQRTMLELLNQLDGFDYRGDVKVIMATNRIETLDPALIRPGKSCSACLNYSHSYIQLYSKVSWNNERSHDTFRARGKCGFISFKRAGASAE